MIRQVLFLIPFLAGFLLSYSSFAQSSLKYPWYVNANAGLTQMYGDIETETDPVGKLSGESGLGYGIRIGRNISPVFTGHFQFLYTSIKAEKQQNNLKFNSDIMEFQLGTTINLTNLILEKKERIVSVYGIVGIGALLHRGKLTNTNTGEIINSVGYTTSGSKSPHEFGISFPMGGGLDFRITDRIFANFETALRLTTTDKIDAAVKGANNDAFYYINAGLSYNFGIKKEPRKVVVPPEIAAKETTKSKDNYINVSYAYPNDLNSMDEFIMSCRISKGNMTGKAELTQILPIGFNVLDSVVANTTTKFRNYTLSLFWDEIPADSAFNISYRIKLDKIFGSLPMTSILYFAETGEEHRFKTDIFIKRKIIAEPIAVTGKKPTNNKMLSPSEKVEFRIQLRASYKLRLSTDSLTALFKLDEPIFEEKIGRWYKYSVGSFKTYDKAKIYRQKINGKPGIKDPFIIAYYDGKRLSKLSELREIAPETLPGQEKPKFKENGYCWRVQILAMKSKQASPSALKSIYNIEQEVNEEIYHNWSKYTVGSCLTKRQALDLRLELVKKGIVGAFLVKYHDGERAVIE